MSDSKIIDQLAGNIKNLTDTVESLAGIVKSEFEGVHKELRDLRQGQENIELKLSNVAYRFEVQDLQNQLNILKQRVDAMDQK